MCTYRDDAMDRAGELPMEKKMDEGMSKTLANLSGAAVRGEPVAEVVGRAALNEFIDKVCLGKSDLISCAEAAFYWFNKSARAADASSEPSDAYIVEIAHRAFLDGRLSWLGFDKDGNGDYNVPTLSKCHFQLVRAVLAAVKSRAADALDSQPTSDELDAARYRWLRRTDVDVGNVIDIETSPGVWEYKSEKELDKSIDDAMASSQPTDGEVRNG